MGKDRISHCNNENIQLVEELKRKTEKLSEQSKSKPLQRQDKRKVGEKSTVGSNYRTPKRLVIYREESRYAATPVVRHSALVQFAIKKSAEEFRNVPNKTTKKISITSVWSKQERRGE